MDLLQTFLDALPSNVVVLDANGVIVRVNKAWVDFGQSSGLACHGNCVGQDYRTLAEHVACCDREIAAQAAKGVEAVIEGKQQAYSMEFKVGGAAKASWYQLRVVQIEQPGAKMTLVMHTDITQSIESQRITDATKERWQAVVANAPIYILLIDRQGRIQFINRADAGSTPDDFTGISVSSMVRPQHVADVERALKEVFDHGRTVTVVSSAQDGDKLRWFKATVGPLQQGESRQAIWIASDITHERTLEDQLRQSQKMEAIGRLAGGVAHDFNNLLTAIMGHAELLGRHMSPGPEQDHVKQILRTSRRATELTQQLLAFSRRQVMQPRTVNLNDCVKDAQKLLARLIGEDVALETVNQRGLRQIMADPTQIEQVLINLAVNARDAMPDGGKLTIETKNVDADEVYCTDRAGMAPGSYVRLRVSDTGTGITPETMTHIFEPFFTTKPVGKGTGLGLSMVHGVVKQSGGHIFVRSDPDKGACFCIYFPAVSGGVEAPRTRTAVIKDNGGNEQILLVEDDADLRELAHEILSAAGYRVRTMANPLEVPAAVNSMQSKPHLLLTDVVMPGMSGGKLAETLRAALPGIKVLYMSGYTANEIGHHGVLNPGVNFIQKPFTISQLTSRVREVLDNPA
ncbi:MAG: PAS domain-containing protein [Planctomycetes bacterium]|nr:PAS domain-containing protein [Planctomycetota bacterium]